MRVKDLRVGGLRIGGAAHSLSCSTGFAQASKRLRRLSLC
jgi:hypothetical protein